MKKIKLTQGKFAIVDDEDFDYLNQWKWYAKFSEWGSYAVRDQHILGSGKKEIKKRIRMHRLILNAQQDKQVDHVNHNGLDNRKRNLRIVTNSQNAMNSRLRKDNTSGYKGVTWSKDKNKWQAQIAINKKYINLGRYSSIQEASLAYQEASKLYHGEYANLS